MADEPGRGSRQSPDLLGAGPSTQDVVNRAVAVAQQQASVAEDEEFTDAQQSSSEEEVESDEEEAAGNTPSAAAAAGREDAGARDGTMPCSPAARAAVGAVEAASAAAVAFEGREWDRQLISLAAIAEAHMQAGKFDKAINGYSDMLRRCGMAGPGASCCRATPRRHAAVLLARSAAYAAFSQQLRSIPAAQSESRALYAPDPCQLATLALKDAEQAAGLDPGSPEPMLHKGYALVLLERYCEAEAALQLGLEGQPTHRHLLHQLRELHAALADADAGTAGATGGSGAAGERAAAACRAACGRVVQMSDDAECVICTKLLYEPVTTPCGHSFCKPCFSRAMDHGNKCPSCRTVLHAGRELAVTITLKNLLQHSFPEEYEQRQQEEREAAAAVPAANAPLPVFVMSLLLPGEKMALNIFEPRYRLMVRRCMEGNRTFGMATVDRQHHLSEVACEAEITECQPLPDGRYYIEILGRRRFRPAETWEQDGYRVARPEYLSDEEPAAGSDAAARLASEVTEVEQLADAWLERLRSLAQTRRGVAELLVRAGDKPAGASPEALSFWVANLICPVLDAEAALKKLLLTTRSTLERLQTERQVLNQLSSTSSQGCSVM